MKPKKKRGPVPQFGESVQRFSISITLTQARALMRLGEGNLSRGVRRALERANETDLP